MSGEANAFARATLQIAALATGPLLALACVLAFPLSSLLNIDSVGIVALAEITLITALVYPVSLGVLQGRQRFHALAGLYVFPWVLRLALLAASAAAGYHLGGALVATVAAAIAAAAAAFGLIARPLRYAQRTPTPPLRPPARAPDV